MNDRIKVNLCGLLLGGFISCWQGAQAGEWGLGLVGKSHQAPQKGADRIQTGILPYLYYEGDSLSVDFQEISYKLAEPGKFELAALGGIRFQGYDPDDSPDLKGMDERKPAFDTGLRLTYAGRWGNLSLSAVTDVSNQHNGHELAASYGFTYPLGRWAIEPAIGLSWQNQDLVNYYYGVSTSEAQAGRPVYMAHSATNIVASVNTSLKITRHFFAVTGIEYRYLGKSIRNSPIIDKGYETGGYVSLLYRF